MNEKDEPQELILRYLSGELSDEAQSRIEEKFFTDEQYFERMLAAEDALIDDFVQGKLSSEDQEKFSRFIASSAYELREIEFVKELIADVLEAGPPELNTSETSLGRPRSKWHSILEYFKMKFRVKQLSLAALVLLGVLSIPVMIWNLRLQRQLRQIEAERNTLEQSKQEMKQQIIEQKEINSDLTEQVESERNLRNQIEKDLAELTQSLPRIARASVASIMLTTEAATRGGSHIPMVHLQPEARQLRIEIELKRSDDFKNYGGVIRTFNGQTVWSTNDIRSNQSSARRLIVQIPTNPLPSDDYIFTLKGQTGDGRSVDIRDYTFRVRR